MENGSAFAIKISIIALIVVLAIGAYIFFFNKNLSVSESQILSSTNIALNFYCSEMQTKAGQNNCAICGETSLILDSNQKSKYEIIKQENGYLVKAQIYMVSNQDKREASFSELIFTLNKEGNLMGSQIPTTQECFENVGNQTQQTI